MIELVEPTTVEELTRDAAATIEHVKETGHAHVLTVDGKAAVVIQDVASYWKLLDRLDYAEALEGIRLGIESMRRGEGIPAEEVFAELRAKYGLSSEE
jgi:hypothetical protein